MKLGSRPPRPRGAFIAVLLVLTLVLAGAIALEAYRNFLGHRATAERVLHDYARLAAARFANRTEMAFWEVAFSPATHALTRAKAGLPNMPLPAPSHLPASTEPHATDFRRLARYSFRYDLPSGRLETSGERPSPSTLKWLRDTLPVHTRTVYDAKEGLGAIVRTVDDVPRAIVYTVVNDPAGAPRTVVGLEEDPAALASLYKWEEDRYPVLPRPITGGVTEDSLVSAIVTAADGRELYRSQVQYAPTFTARDSFEYPAMGGVRVQVALRPDVAPKLVIGGMPRSNVPMLIALLALTAVLVVAALLQLWREYDLARLRADFVSGVSHELRTPLAQIRMFSETLLLGRVRSAAERLRSLEIIDQEARRL
ncbi:MAG TPA: histidine kinase dimerization/phospho-acceptor domain-containing protein, partial [Gemmatimonadales bacterium]|nr:histidine kinase dimerization/phospho-acceptor domain-containing protein [Gemmatimonadales bacterium]